MQPPDNELFVFIKEWLWAPIMGLIAWGWNHHTKRVDDLRDYVDDEVDDIKGEVNRQRDVSAKIFDKLEEHSKQSAERHIELLTVIHTGLAKKADK